jgi:hypothetical protein
MKLLEEITGLLSAPDARPLSMGALKNKIKNNANFETEIEKLIRAGQLVRLKNGKIAMPKVLGLETAKSFPAKRCRSIRDAKGILLRFGGRKRCGAPWRYRGGAPDGGARGA